MLLACISLVILIGSAYLLLTGSPLLLMPAVEAINLPAGTLIAWAGLIALPAAIYLFTPQSDRQSSRLNRLAINLLRSDLLLAGSWGLVAYGLSGSWAFTFSGVARSFRGSDAASAAFWGYTVLIVAAALPGLMLLVGRAIQMRTKA